MKKRILLLAALVVTTGCVASTGGTKTDARAQETARAVAVGTGQEVGPRGELTINGAITGNLSCVPGLDCFMSSSHEEGFVKGYTISINENCLEGCVSEKTGEVEESFSVILAKNVISMSHQQIIDRKEQKVELPGGKEGTIASPQLGVCTDAVQFDTSVTTTTELCGMTLTWTPTPTAGASNAR